MVDSIRKYIKKLGEKDSIICEKIIEDIYADRLSLYDVKKMSGHKDLYRLRKGDMRIIFKKNENGPNILKVGNRDENTYRSY